MLVGQEVRARDSPSPPEMERVIKCRQLNKKKQCMSVEKKLQKV